MSNGAFLPLDDLIKPHEKELYKAVPPEILEGARVQGKLYAIPSMKEMAELNAYHINETYLKKYNLSIEKKDAYTLKDFFPAFEVIKKNEKGIYPINIVSTSILQVESLDYIIGPKFPGAIKVSSKNLKVINQFKDPEQLKKIYEFREAFLKGYIPKDVLSMTEDSSVVTSGKWFLNFLSYQPGSEKIYSRLHGYDVKIFQEWKHPLMTTSSATGSMFSIPASSKNPEKAMEFITLLDTDSYLRNLINNGIEGTHYEKINENTIKLLSGAKEYNMPAFSLGNLLITYLFSDDIPNKWDEFKKFNESATISPMFGFTFDTSPVKNEVAAIVNIADEYSPAIFTGAIDPDKQIKEMLDKMERAGLQKVLNEMQKQLDEWKKNK